MFRLNSLIAAKIAVVYFNCDAAFQSSWLAKCKVSADFPVLYASKTPSMLEFFTRCLLKFPVMLHLGSLQSDPNFHLKFLSHKLCAFTPSFRAKVF